MRKKFSKRRKHFRKTGAKRVLAKWRAGKFRKRIKRVINKGKELHFFDISHVATAMD